MSVPKNQEVRMANVNQKFEITVWFRYISNGEQEKDFEIHEIEAVNIQEAVDNASGIYNSFKTIPFMYLFENEKYKPTKTK